MSDILTKPPKSVLKSLGFSVVPEMIFAVCSDCQWQRYDDLAEQRNQGWALGSEDFLDISTAKFSNRTLA